MNTNGFTLLVNTNVEQLQQYASYLHKQGFEMLISNDFERSVEIAKSKRPRVVIIFIQKNDGDAVRKAMDRFSLLDLTIIAVDLTMEQSSLSADSYKYGVRFKELPSGEDLMKACMNSEKATTDKPKARARILLVEDDELTRAYFSVLLDKLSITYLACSTITDAIELLSNNEFELIVSDVKLRGGTGIDILKKARSVGYPDSRLLFISGYDEQELQAEHKDFNFIKVLKKPIDGNTFLKEVSNSLALNTGFNPEKGVKKREYDYGEIAALLKNDKIKMRSSLNEFLSILNNSIELSESIDKTGNMEELRLVFHDILNLATYYGAGLLFDLVMQFKQEKDVERKAVLLEQINAEQKNVFHYYGLIKKQMD